MSDKQTVKFGDICREVKLTTKDPIADGYERYIGLEHLDSRSLKIKRWGLIAEDNPSFTRVFKRGNILFGKRRPYLKKAAIAEFDGICSGDILVLDVKEKTIPKDIFYYLVSSNKVWKEAIRSSSGSLSPRTKFKSLSEIEFSLPKKEQLVSSENFITLAKKIIAESRHLSLAVSDTAKSSIRSLLRYGNVNKAQLTNYGKLGSVPAHWEWKNLGDLAKKGEPAIRTGPFGSALKADHWCLKGRPVITIGCLGEYGYDQYEELYINEGYALNLQQYSVKKGDIVFSRVADIGRSILIDDETSGAIISSNLMKISLDERRVDPRFYFYSIKYSPIILHQITKFTNSGGRLLVTSKDLKKIKFPTPPYNEQIKIADSIERLLMITEGIDNSVRLQEDIVSGYISRIFS
ncbi:MAG: type I restriction endonuclease subunit S [Gammaproteobacteria bacterium HGW-Gammaproteobacteria-15]|nr:MAG: type I restriction endonuclease subunit S [Gammaproteobacteria bacterium HGW-Gammaproteobacteria-15]